MGPDSSPTAISQGSLGTEDNQDAAWNLVAEGQKDELGKHHSKRCRTDDFQTPGGSSHGTFVSLFTPGCSSETRPSSPPQGGSGADDVARDGEPWFGNALPVIEEPPDLGLDG